MILDNPIVTLDVLERETGWAIKPQGACKGDRCVPLPDPPAGASVDVRELAPHLGMPLVHDEAHGVWALGPEGGGRVLDTARLPDIVLPDLDGHPFDLASLRGQKVLLVAWASW